MADQPTLQPLPEDLTQPVIPDAQQFAAIEAKIKEELGPQQPLGSLLDRAVDESERRARDKIITQQETFKYQQRLALLFAESGCFADIKGGTAKQLIAQAFVKIALGESMGFTPAESMQGVDLISGRPAVGAHLRAARMQRAGYSWEIDWLDNENGQCEGCRLWLYKDGKPLLKPVRDREGVIQRDADGNVVMDHVSVSFTKADAEAMKTTLWEGPKGHRTPRTASILEKDNWKNTPRNMYWARCITNAQRWHAPAVLSGDVPSTEEALDGLYEDGGNMGVSSAETLEDVRERKIAEAKQWYADRGLKPPASIQQQEQEQAGEQSQEEPSSIADALLNSGNPTQVGDTTVAAVGPNTTPAVKRTLFGGGKGGAK